MAPSEMGVYIHIPFCQVRCSYCDFNTYAGLDNLVDSYVAALCDEIRGYPHRTPLPDGESASPVRPQQEASGQRRRASTIYLGGGTPSLLSTTNLEHILTSCRQSFAVDPGAEVTIEANPGTVSAESLRATRAMGFNRLSLGVQSLDDAMLHLLDRLHTADQAIAAYVAARQAGFDNISLDFIYGLPGQSLEHWQKTLDQAIALRPDHLSLYALTLEDHVPMARRVAAGALSLPDEDSVADMYTLAEEALQRAGYIHYEISNWATSPETASRHNSLYWRRQPYRGFGAGAHSFDGQQRFSNVLHPREYITRISSGGSALSESETITPDMARSETMFLGLRLLLEGVTDEQFAAQHGRSLSVYAPQIDDLVRSGLLQWVDGRLLLTRRGRLLSNQAFVRFL